MPKIFKIKIILFALIFACLLSSSAIFAISPLEKAKADYSFQLTKLSDFHEKFITAKANYLAYQTAVSKNEAFLKTKDYYLQVFNVYTSYLFLIEERTNIFDWSLSTFKKDDVHSQLEKEAGYMNNNLKQAQSFQTIEEIQANSIALEDHIKTVALPIVSKTLSTSDIAQVEDSLSSFTLLSQKIDIYVKDKIKTSDQPLYQNWKSEVENIKKQLSLLIIDSKKTLGQSSSVNFSDQNTTLANTFIPDSQKILDRAKNILYEILNFI